ncbi:MAG TPA: hypothetical protein VGV67_12855 [Solirubrobacteraceae bacterium]|nr:hypothetical protein [Solirubrobacteraceae bacterium]
MTGRQTELAALLLVGLGVAVLGWKELGLLPAAGVDGSWSAVLYMTRESGIGWGRDLVFTYGPLGFLKVPAFYSDGGGTLALLYTFAARVALAASLWLFARRTFGRVGAALVALVVVPYVPHPLPVVALGWGLWLLAGERSVRQWRAFAGVAGVVGGLELLGKVNIGVLLVALGAIAVAFAPRDRVRLAAIFAGAAAGGLLVGWIATGQRLLDLNDYLVHAADIASGYSMAMVYTLDGVAWHYTAALVVLALAVHGVWTGASWSASRARAGSLVLFGAFAFVAFKSGFVRHDDSHAREFFGMMLAALVVVP